MRTIHCDTIRIDKVLETERWVFAAEDIFPAISPALVERGRLFLNENFIDGSNYNLFLSVHSYLIRAANQNILVDTCNGNHKLRPSLRSRHKLNTSYLSNLEAFGIEASDIDVVVCTHLHPDHCGWNTTLHGDQWIPTFPNAKYLMNKDELHCLAMRCHAALKDGRTNDVVEMYSDSIAPVLQSGQCTPFSSGHQILDDADLKIIIEVTGGHSLAHSILDISDGLQHVIMTGDVIHHPIQLMDLYLANASDFDPVFAAEVRKSIVSRYADTETIILPSHFGDPTAGRIVKANGSYQFKWLEAENDRHS